jgi:hypothetical protein
MTHARAIGPVGTGLRITFGLLIIAAALIFDYPSRGIGWWDVAGALIMLPLIAVGAAWLVNAAYRRKPAMARRARTPWSAAQAGAAAIVISAVVAVGTALTFVTPIDRIAIFLFFGASMLLAAVQGYDGCEILALPNTILRRSDAVWCPIYSPIDSAEQRPGDQPVQVDQEGAGDAELRQPR